MALPMITADIKVKKWAKPIIYASAMTGIKIPTPIFRQLVSINIRSGQ